MENNIISYIKNISVNGLEQYSEQTIAEGIRFLYENIRSLALGLTILPLVLAAVMWNQVDNTVLIIWVLIALTIRMIRQWLAYLYFKVSPTPQEAVQWGRYFTYSSILMGTVYGSTAILFLHQILYLLSYSYLYLLLEWQMLYSFLLIG